jgi:hypothetical protein
VLAGLFLPIAASLPIVEGWPGRGNSPGVSALTGDALLLAAQAGQSSEASRPENRPSLTRGMGKEAVRQAWGAPEQVRKIRTCFGWQEEWVYRGAEDQSGASEQVLLFDEGELLTEIK